MADAEQLREAGRRLATDLRELREERGVDADAILEATRLSADIFKAFDETALVDHPAFNRVYLRSIVSSYSKVLEIEEADGLRALEEALRGKYHGALRQKYLARSDPGAGPSFSLIEEDADVAPAEDDVVPDTLLPDAQIPRRVGKSGNFNTLNWSIRGMILIAVALLLFWVVGLLLDDDTPSGLEIETFTSPVVVVTPPAPDPEPIVLGDSIRFDVVAPIETLDPIRLTVDRDIRRPYWIEHLDTLTFYAVEQIAFERELDVAEIWMEGYQLSDSLIDANGQLRMNRDRGQAWLDTLLRRTALRD